MSWPTPRRHPRQRAERGRLAKEIDDAVVKSMHAEGRSTADISLATGFHKSTIHAAFKRLGLSSNWSRVVAAGDRFGRYVVICEVDAVSRKSGVRVRAVLARCDCGTEKQVRLESLWSGTTMSCGCYHADLSRATLAKASITHGRSRSDLHRIWSAMKARCSNPANKRWASYGGRGIRVCDEWRSSFPAFAAHVGTKPAGMTLDRIDNDGHYEPGNVRWATYSQQARNTRRSAVVELNGERMPLVAAVERLGVKYDSLQASLRKGTPLAKKLGVARVQP